MAEGVISMSSRPELSLRSRQRLLLPNGGEDERFKGEPGSCSSSASTSMAASSSSRPIRSCSESESISAISNSRDCVGGSVGGGAGGREVGGFSSDIGAARHPTPYTSDESGGRGGLVLRPAAAA